MADQIVETEGMFMVVFHTGWATWCETREEAEALISPETESAAPNTKAERVAYAGGTRYHAVARVLRSSDGLVKTQCGQRGWISKNPANLTPCRKCF